MDLRQSLLKHQELSAHVRQLQAQLDAARRERLARLPDEFGFPDLPSFIRALRRAAQSTSPARIAPKRRRRVSAKLPAPAVAPSPASAAAPAAIPSPEPAPTPPVAPAIPARPTGTSLDDPANFGLMPDRSILQPATLPLPLQRERLGEALRFATRVLHTSKVPAAVWREWRQFERQLTEALRASLPVADLDTV